MWWYQISCLKFLNLEQKMDRLAEHWKNLCVPSICPLSSNALMTDLSCQSWLHITLKSQVVILWSVLPVSKLDEGGSLGLLSTLSAVSNLIFR